MSYEGGMLARLKMPSRQEVEDALIKTMFKHDGVIKEFAAGEEIVDDDAELFSRLFCGICGSQAGVFDGLGGWELAFGGLFPPGVTPPDQPCPRGEAAGRPRVAHSRQKVKTAMAGRCLLRQDTHLDALNAG